MSKVITVSRELGSGGREVGLRLAKKLGIPFYDKELIAMAAEDSNISEDLFHANDEVIAGQKRINYDDYATVDPFSPVYEVPVSDQLFVIQSKIIQRLAANGPCVIIGRCSDVIVEDAFRIFICSSFKKRVERIQGLEKEPEDLKKLESRIRAVDAKRRDYYQYYSGNEWGKPKNYDLCLNSGTFGIERCVEIIANSVTLE